jgi:hypothetical protein
MQKITMQKITDKILIQKILRKSMLSNFLICSLFTREHRQGGIIFEGVKVLSSCKSNNETIYTLTNSDSNYRQLLATVKLSGIEYITI